MTKDKDGKPLSEEEQDEYTNDLFDCGIPGTREAFNRLWDKWGERLGIAKPKDYT